LGVPEQAPHLRTMGVVGSYKQRQYSDPIQVRPATIIKNNHCLFEVLSALELRDPSRFCP